ncbi:hypothetical protein TrVE_jg14330 [Triparma verrucosa]|uniref:Uncharacterized protein n=1 Tax=Triparma verrucosa TaxID=1606542 RepID=A0A9W7BSP5_9STRA|nr:hypothetical protein TrVE_jg14330 [Triparma verrucosa]
MINMNVPRRGLSRLNKQLLMGIFCAALLTFVTYSAITSTSLESQNDELQSFTLSSSMRQAQGTNLGTGNKTYTPLVTEQGEKLGRGHMVTNHNRKVKGGGVATTALAGGEFGVMGGMRQSLAAPAAAKPKPVEASQYRESEPASAESAVLSESGPSLFNIVRSTTNQQQPSKAKKMTVTKTTVEEVDGVVKKTTVTEEVVEDVTAELSIEFPPLNEENAPAAAATTATGTKKAHPPRPRPLPRKAPVAQASQTTEPGFTGLPVPVLLCSSTFAVFFGVSVARHIRHKGLMRDCIENEPYDDVRFKTDVANELGEEPLGYPPTYGTVGAGISGQDPGINNGDSFINRAMSYGSASFRGPKAERFDV